MDTRNLRWTARSFVGRHPWLYFPLLHLVQSPRRHQHVRRDTEIVIEGYPRTANTFAVCAFLCAQGRPVRVARHIHLPAQVIQAVRWSIPTLILIRNPEDAVLSLLTREPLLSASRAVKDYIRFYRSVQELRDRVVLATFEAVTQDFGLAIEALNRKFATKFIPFVHTEDSVAQVFKMVDEMDQADTKREAITFSTVARPVSEREQMKGKRRGDLHAVQSVLWDAQNIYERLTATADV